MVQPLNQQTLQNSRAAQLHASSTSAQRHAFQYENLDYVAHLTVFSDSFWMTKALLCFNTRVIYALLRCQITAVTAVHCRRRWNARWRRSLEYQCKTQFRIERDANSNCNNCNGSSSKRVRLVLDLVQLRNFPAAITCGGGFNPGLGACTRGSPQTRYYFNEQLRQLFVLGL